MKREIGGKEKEYKTLLLYASDREKPLIQALRREAKKRGMSLSQLMRYWILAGLRETGKEEDDGEETGTDRAVHPAT